MIQYSSAMIKRASRIDHPEIAKFVRTRMEELRLTPLDLSKALRVSRAAVSHMTVHGHVGKSRIFALAKLLKCDPARLAPNQGLLRSDEMRIAEISEAIELFQITYGVKLSLRERANIFIELNEHFSKNEQLAIKDNVARIIESMKERADRGA